MWPVTLSLDYFKSGSNLKLSNCPKEKIGNTRILINHHPPNNYANMYCNGIHLFCPVNVVAMLHNLPTNYCLIKGLGRFIMPIVGAPRTHPKQIKNLIYIFFVFETNFPCCNIHKDFFRCFDNLKIHQTINFLFISFNFIFYLPPKNEDLILIFPKNEL